MVCNLWEEFRHLCDSWAGLLHPFFIWLIAFLLFQSSMTIRNKSWFYDLQLKINNMINWVLINVISNLIKINISIFKYQWIFQPHKIQWKGSKFFISFYLIITQWPPSKINQSQRSTSWRYQLSQCHLISFLQWAVFLKTNKIISNSKNSQR